MDGGKVRFDDFLHLLCSWCIEIEKFAKDSRLKARDLRRFFLESGNLRHPRDQFHETRLHLFLTAAGIVRSLEESGNTADRLGCLLAHVRNTAERYDRFSFADWWNFPADFREGFFRRLYLRLLSHQCVPQFRNLLAQPGGFIRRVWTLDR